jgi:hypothetical protein
MDRVYPQRVGEVYSLHHNKSQRWYWLSDQTTEEVFVTIMYDSVAGSHARCEFPLRTLLKHVN